jgi:hypothetical protein
MASGSLNSGDGTYTVAGLGCVKGDEGGVDERGESGCEDCIE